ncbi:GNAT family N-acetyltransferase [Rhabdochromatium marinum]|uniref:GNAT family N-acetyltransferase n=1 Tax=Rhabdochromatium marinum TaxID=48729 RepID=UPI0019047872|nr:GNAT family N-acetyltransferase [Rhabdochromatium marinum]
MAARLIVSVMNKMEIIEIPKESIHEIEPLWRELNSHHHEKSNNFKGHFSSFTFTERSKKLLAMDNLAIFAVKENSELVGYCIASSNNGAGEIDSLYIKPQFRGASLGMLLTESAMAWLSGLNCSQISVYVAEGNEDAIPFYEKFDFKTRFHVLQIINS